MILYPDPTWHEVRRSPERMVMADREAQTAAMVPPMGHRFDAGLRCHGCGQHYESHQRMRLACPMPQHAERKARRESREGRKQRGDRGRYEREPENEVKR